MASTSLAAARSLYFSWVDNRLPYAEKRRVGAAMLSLSSDDRVTLHRFHELGDQTDRDGERAAVARLAKNLSTSVAIGGSQTAKGRV